MTSQKLREKRLERRKKCFTLSEVVRLLHFANVPTKGNKHAVQRAFRSSLTAQEFYAFFTNLEKHLSTISLLWCRGELLWEHYLRMEPLHE